MEKTKVAVIGCGTIANSAHGPSYQKNPNVKIAYCVDIIPERAQAFKEKFGDEDTVALTDYHDFLSDESVKAVSVCVPNYLHNPITITCVRAGKNVLCEKPASVSYNLAKEMADVAHETGKILNIGVVNRFNYAVNMIKKYVEEGRLGDVYHVYCSFRAHRSIPGLGGPFTTKELAGGGVLIDWGVHFLDLILYVLGGAKLKTVTCDAYCEMAKDMKSYKYEGMWAEDTADVEHGTNDVDDLITGHIRTDKASISFNGAWAQNLDKNEMYIDFLGDKCGARLTYGDKFELTDGSTLKTEQPEYDIPNMYLQENKAFIESITTGEKKRCHIDSILESAKLLDVLYASAEKKEEIKL